MAVGEAGVLRLADDELLLYSLASRYSGFGKDKVDVGSIKTCRKHDLVNTSH